MGDFSVDFGRHGIWVAILERKRRFRTHFPNGERTRISKFRCLGVSEI